MNDITPLSRNSKVLAVIALVLFFAPVLVDAQHNWSFNEKDYAFSGEIDALVVMSGTEQTGGMLGAFVGDECRGYVEGMVFGPTGKTVFLLLTYSNESSGELMNFKYYDEVGDKVYNISEIQEFSSNMKVGDANFPVELNAIVTNMSPVADCPDYTLMNSEVGPHIFDMEAIFSDADGDHLLYAAVGSAGTLVEWPSATTVRFTAAASGVSTLELTASDAEFTVSCDYTFDIDPSNTRPQVDAEISDLGLEEGFVSTEIDLSSVFSDADMDVLTYSASSSNTEVVTVGVSGDKLTVTEVGGGNSLVTVTADDSKLDVSDAFQVVVISDAPAVPWTCNANEYAYKGTIVAEVFVNGDVVTSGDLAAFVGTECRGKTSGAYFAPTGKTLFSIDVYGNEMQGEFLTFRYYHSLTGVVKKIVEFIEFKPEMQLGSVADPFAFNIQDENNIPIIDNPLADVAEDEHFGSVTISLAGVFSDPDSDDLSYSIEGGDEVVSAVISGTDLVVTEVGLGVTELVVRASDGEFVIDDRFGFTVNNVNDAPVLTNPILNLYYQSGFRSVSIDVSEVFVDPDGDLLSYRTEIDDEQVVSAYFEGSNMILREEGLGTASITLFASDGEFELSNNIVLTVNDVPQIVCESFVDTCMIEGAGPFVIAALCDSVIDLEGDLISFTSSSSDESVATVDVVDCDLVITEVGLGVTTIEFCASDGVESKCCSFEFAVKEENVLSISYDGEVIGYQDSIMINSEAADLMISVSSGVEWSFVTYSDWMQEEIIDETTLKISCVENTSAEWRMDIAIVKDVQGHEAAFYVHQSGAGSGVSELEGAWVVSVYPNPTSGKLRVEPPSVNSGHRFGKLWNRGEYEMSVIDNSGKVILVESGVRIDGNGIELDVSGLKDGVYYLRLSNALGTIYDLPFVKRQ